MNLTLDLYHAPEKRCLSNGDLMHTVLSIAQFSTREVIEPGNDRDYVGTCLYHAAYLIACFIANHTRKGEEGVDADYVESKLKLTKLMPDEDRLVLVGELIGEFR